MKICVEERDISLMLWEEAQGVLIHPFSSSPIGRTELMKIPHLFLSQALEFVPKLGLILRGKVRGLFSV